MAYKILYICGNGHSGSTLLDIVLGSPKDSFSAGELTFITRDSIMDEYCSCGNKISNCILWNEIIHRWESKRKISYKEYQRLRLKFERNKMSLNTLWNKFYPSDSFEKYIDATKHLFASIHEVTGATTIIDSSKSPTRIAILQKVADLEVIHLCRDFKGVLNSAKRSSKKNIEAGIEVDNPAKKTFKVLMDWIITNFFSEVFSFGVKSNKLKYKNFVQKGDSLSFIQPELDNIREREFYSADHMLAGNVIRLKKGVKINPNLGFSYGRLSKRQKSFSNVINSAFWFWR